MSYAIQKDSSRRLTGLAVVIALHAALIYALIHGLARQIVEVIRQPLETKIIEEIKAPPPDKPPPPPPPKLTIPPPYIPPPEVQVQNSVPAPTITAVTNVKPEPVRTAAVVDARTCEKPAYPPAALRAHETGVVLLSFLIDADGRVLDGKIERSSGFRRLDEAAKGGLALCKFRPATIDGRPERSRASIEYVWKIE